MFVQQYLCFWEIYGIITAIIWGYLLFCEIVHRLKTGCLIETRPDRISEYARSADAVYMAGTDKEEWHIKKTKNLLRHMTVWVVTAAMLLTSLPLLTVPVEAVQYEIPPRKTTYTVKTTVANERNAKTDNDVYCIVKDARGHEHSILLDKKGDDFQKGETDEYTFTLDLYPWEIHAVGFQHKSGADAVKLHKFSFWTTIEGKQHWFVRDKEINTWFHKYKKTYSILADTDRELTLHGFDEVFGDWEYFNPEVESADDIVLAWDGTAWDQYYYSYNFFKTDPGAVGIEFSSSGKSYNGRSSFGTAVLTGNDNKYAKIDNINGLNNQITLKTGAILKYMRENQIYKFTLTSKLDYLYDYDAYGAHSNIFIIIRKGFDLGKPSAITKAYTPFIDQNFYNSNAAYSTFEVKIPVLSFDNYDASRIASSLAANIKNGTVPARVYYGATGTSDYVVPTDAYSRGCDVYLKCKTPSGYNNPDGKGITVQLDDAQATYNYSTYWLDHQKSASDTSRSNDYSEYISTHKVDTAGVALTVLNSDGSALDSAFDSYAKTHTFRLQSSENRIFLENSNGTRSEGYFSYQLLSADGKTVKALKNYKTAPTTKVPYTTNAVYTVEPKETLEGDYQLRITTRDIANNPTTLTYPIKIDTIAPRAKYSLKQLTPIDGSRRNEYTFTIEDATGTGKLYYCIVPDGETMSVPGNDIPEHTGAVESQYNRWSFINQSGDAKTAVVSVPKGQYFEGTLYWYTVDAAGNDSRDEKIKGTDAAGYFYTDIFINNIDAECKLVVENSTPGRPYYMISFDTNVNNRVEYQWRSATVTTKKTVYSANYNPGASMQTLANGGSIVLNGEYTLEYTVITPDGSSKSYTEKFLFDNNAPVVKMSYDGDAVAASKAMTIEVSDITNITKLTYQLHKADGAAVGEPVALNCGLPVVTADLMLEPEVPGMYYVTVTAVDVNGQTSMQTSEVFGIRNGQPVQILGETVDFHIDAYGSIMYKDSNNSPIWIGTEYNGIPLTNQRTLTFQWNVVEPMENVHLTNANHEMLLKENYALFYRFSADGINYSAWECHPRTLKYDHKLEATIEVTNPIVLREGENRIWIQAAFALNGTDPATIRPEMIATNNDRVVILDVTAPEYTFEIDSMEPTADSVFGTVVFSDAYSSLDDLKWGAYNDDATSYAGAIVGTDITAYSVNTPEQTEGESTETDGSAEVVAPAVPTEKTLRLEIFSNGTHSVVLTDKAGNSVSVPVAVECIDKVAPDVYVESANPITAGERQDYMINFWVDKADDTTTEFALIRPLKELTDSDFGTISPSTTPNPEHPGWDYTVNLQSKDIVWGTLPGDAPAGKHGTILDYNSMKVSPIVTDVEYPNGESRTNYEILVYADEYNGGENEYREEPYILAVKTSDMLGNETIQSVGNYMLLRNATAQVSSAESLSEYAYQVAGIHLKMSVPVYVLPYDKIPASMLGLADGRLDQSGDATVADFAENINDAAVSYTAEPVVMVTAQTGVNGEIVTPSTWPIFYADEAGRVYKKTLTIADPAVTDRNTTGTNPTVYLKFVDTAPVEVALYRGDYVDFWETNYPETMTELRQLTNVTSEGIQAYSDAYTYYVVLSVTESNAEFTSATSSNSGVSVNWYDEIVYDDDFTEVLIGDEEDKTTKVFVLNNTLNPTKSISYNVKITETIAGEEGAEPTVAETVIGSAYQLTLRDTTLPDVMVQYSTKGFTNQPVTATIIASDAEFMTDTDGENDAIDGTEELVSSNGIKEIAITDFLPQEYFISYGMYAPPTLAAIKNYDYDIQYSDVSEISLAFSENGVYGVRVTNEVGLVSYAVLEVTNIYNGEILLDTYEYDEEAGEYVGVEGDYRIRYYDADSYTYHEEVDEWFYDTEIDIDSNVNYYKEVIAEIELTFSGWDEKSIQVINNGGKFTKSLTANERSFVFTLRDKYGNEAEVDVAFDRFDTTAPTIEYVPSVTQKTNQSFPVWLYAADTESGVASVTAVQHTMFGVESVPVKTDDGTYENPGAAYMLVSQSGNYAVTVTDNSGNTAETTFTVSNIDTTKPTIASVKYTVSELTRNDVGVKLYYSEPNVTLKEVIPGEGLTANDISVNYTESIIRFYKNGDVQVVFEDEYGNPGEDSSREDKKVYVGVSNIFREAPVLTAVTTLASDALSADVTFTVDPAQVRDLSKYYVIHRGVTPVDENGEVIRADQVKFTFIDNGTYTFFVHDTLGNMKELQVTIDGIDRTAPVITGVKWSYSYTAENGSVQSVEQTVTPGTEAGYNVVEDENNPATNQDITASVTTDKDTKFAGSDAAYGTEHSVIYDSDGWFNFDMVSPNGLMDSYGLGLYLIDKEAPIIEGAEDLMFFENVRANAPFDLSLLAVTAYDERYGKTTDLTDQIKYSYTYNGETKSVEKFADLAEIGNLPYDKSKPITVTYTVCDSVGNEASVRRTVTLVGLFDTTIRVNGGYTDANGMIEVDGSSVTLELDNFAGMAWARYESGIHTMGQMKNKGTVIAPQADGTFRLDRLSEGWYTFYVQTDLRDYFCVKVYVFAQ
ncbi:MAG: hypothetical protein E7604_07030 [Ruminococcaceae bacterium]|nr:hypothetical protein [Oscillospiraceae bacterium]